MEAEQQEKNCIHQHAENLCRGIDDEKGKAEVGLATV
jgi:hypothetical protein